MKDIEKLLDTAAHAVPTSQNLAKVTARTTALRRRRTALASAGFVALVLVAAPVWQSLTARPGLVAPVASPSPTATRLDTSMQSMLVSSGDLDNQFRGMFTDLSADRGLIEIHHDGTIESHPRALMPADSEKGVFGNGSMAVHPTFLPGHSDADACWKADEDLIIFDEAGQEMLRRRLPRTCTGHSLIGTDGVDAYLQQDNKIVVFNPATQEYRTQMEAQRIVDVRFTGGDIVVAELAKPPARQGESTSCEEIGWTIRTYNVATGVTRSQGVSGTACTWRLHLAVSPDGTHVAIVRQRGMNNEVLIVNMLTGHLAVQQNFGNEREKHALAAAWADEKTAWVAWFPVPSTPTRLADIIQISVFPI